MTILSPRRPRRMAAAVAVVLSMVLAPALASAANAEESFSHKVTVKWPSGTGLAGKPIVISGTVAPAGKYGLWVSYLRMNDRASGDLYPYTATDGTFRVTLPSGPAGSVYRIWVNPATSNVDFDQQFREIKVTSPDHESGKKTTSVTAALSRQAAAPFQPVYLSGRVTGPARPIQVVEQVARGWVVVAKGRTSTSGFYRVKVPTTWFGSHRYAVKAPYTATFRTGQSGTRAVAVRIGYKPQGSARAWSYVNGSRWRFNPCQAVTYRVNLSGAPKGALGDVHGAIRRVSQATGLRFQYKGTTGHRPFANRPGKAPADAALTIAWATPRQAPRLAGNVAGLGGAIDGEFGKDAKGEVAQIQRAGALLDSTSKLAAGFGSGPRYGYQGTRGQLLMHEIGHAVGLGHTPRDRAQIMFPMMSRKPAQYGAGDLTGLRALGLATGCITMNDGYGRLMARRVVPEPLP